jgi:YjjG family noncanonical pyrimidine nucleotidase
MKNTFKWLLFDFDNTLVDFTSTAEKALYLTFERQDLVCNEVIYQKYEAINHQVWTDFEHGKINAEDLRIKRFVDLLEWLGEKAKSPKAFSDEFLSNLVELTEAYDGVIELLEALKGKYKMSIVSNGLKEVQRSRLEKLGMTHFFDSIIISDEIGFQKPSKGFFEYTWQTIANPPSKSEVLIIGDSLNSDILGGRNFGIQTCWNSFGKENKSDIAPNYIIQNVLELKGFLIRN